MSLLSATMDSLNYSTTASASAESQHPWETTAFKIALAGWFSLEFVAGALLQSRFGGMVDTSAMTQIRQNVVSCAHCTYAVLSATLLLLSIEPHPEDPSVSFVPNDLVTTVGSGLFAFLTWDLIHMATNMKVYGKEVLEMTVRTRPRDPRCRHPPVLAPTVCPLCARPQLHHGLYMAMMTMNMDSTYYNYCFALLYFGELSTLFLNIRTAYRLLGWAELWASKLFALSFFLARIVLMCAGRCLPRRFPA